MRVSAFLAYLVILLVPTWVLADSPVVSNIQMSQRTDGTGLVDITYDVADLDGDLLAISLYFSDDGGASWDFPVLNVSGDLGLDVVPGNGKSIVWDAGTIPDDLVFENFSTRIHASDVGVLSPPHSPRNVAITDWGHIDWNDQANIEKYARADVFLAMAAEMWGDEFGNTPVVDQIKAINPDIKIIGYVSAKTAQLSGESPSANAFWHAWYVNTKPFWVYTTQADTAQDWPGNVLLNILEPDCRTAMIETIQEFQADSANKLDGILWDYFAHQLWVADIVSPLGDPDMDGDGIGHWNDPDERLAFKNAQILLIEAARDSLGSDYLQFFNGTRAHTDSTFAGLADGVMYELFPTLVFPDPDMANVLDMSYSANLFRARDWLRAQNGGPYVVMSNVWQNMYVDQNGTATRILTGNVYRAVSLLMDGYSSWNSHDGSTLHYTYGWTDNDISLGPAIGPVVFDGIFIRREFKYGRIEVEMKTGRYPNPFDYRIWALGQLVEELRIPFHYP